MFVFYKNRIFWTIFVFLMIMTMIGSGLGIVPKLRN